MKKILGLLLLAAITFSCANSGLQKKGSKEVKKEVKAKKVEISGRYTILELNGVSLKDKDFGDKTPMMLLDGDKMRYSTSIGCNQIGGNYTLEGNVIKFLPGMATMMACPDDLEANYLSALSEVDNYKIENFMLKMYKGNELKVVFQPLKR
jgi:heat shock protein HslJ